MQRKRLVDNCQNALMKKHGDMHSTVDETIVQKQIAGSEAKMPVILENAKELPTRLNQLNCTVKSEPEENSSESFGYLQQEIDDPHTAIVQNQISGNVAKVLIILEDGKQRLITFEVPKEDCTVQELLEQVKVALSTQEPQVSLVLDQTLGINYIVDDTTSTSVSHKVTKKKILKERMSNETANLVNTVELKTLIDSKPHIAQPMTNKVTLYKAEKNAVSTSGRRKSRGRRQERERMSVVSKTLNRTPKYIEGMLAVCSFCGMKSYDFNYCVRCKRQLPEYVKPIPISACVLPTKKNTVPVETLYKTNEAALTHKTEKDTVANTRQIKDSEYLNISSDEEDNSRKQKRLKIND